MTRLSLLTFISTTILLGQWRDVTGTGYILNATPDLVQEGRSLELDIKLTDYTHDVANVKLIVNTSGRDVVVFDASNTGCRFVHDTYIATGKIELCDMNNYNYKLIFHGITASHIGQYRVESAGQTPDRSVGVRVGFLQGPRTVEITPESVSVLANDKLQLKCTVDRSVSLPIEWYWRHIQKRGSRVPPPPGARAFVNADQYSATLQWYSVGKDDRGEYECIVRNNASQVTSVPAMIYVVNPADNVTLTVSRTDVKAGQDVSVTCKSSGGHPIPGLIIFNAKSGKILKEVREATTRSLVLTMKADVSVLEIACRTIVRLKKLEVPTIQSNTIELRVQNKHNRLPDHSLSTIQVVSIALSALLLVGIIISAGFCAWVLRSRQNSTTPTGTNTQERSLIQHSTDLFCLLFPTRVPRESGVSKV